MKGILLSICISVLFVSINTNGQVVDFIASDACYGDQTTLINVSGGFTGNVLHVGWDLNIDGEFNNGTGDTISYYFYSPGYHTVGMRVITDNGFIKAVYKQIFIGYFPLPNFTVENGCTFETTEFINTSSIQEGSIEEYVWYYGDGSSPDYLENPNHIYNESGSYTVKLVAVSDQGCTDSVTQTINIDNKPPITLDYDGDTVFYQGDSLIITVIGDFDEVLWSDGDWQRTKVIKTSGIYTVEVFKGACSNTAVIPVTVLERPKYGVMNVITPNGDGYNDTWEIALLSQIGPCQVVILDRYGREIYTNTDYDNSWKGTFEGETLDEGAYYYIVRCDDGEIRRGTINIIR